MRELPVWWSCKDPAVCPPGGMGCCVGAGGTVLWGHAHPHCLLGLGTGTWGYGTGVRIRHWDKDLALGQVLTLGQDVAQALGVGTWHWDRHWH